MSKMRSFRIVCPSFLRESGVTMSRLAVLALAGCLAIACSAQAMIMVDYGPGDQVVQSGWEGLSLGTAAHTDATAFGNVTHNVTQGPGGSWQQRNRASGYPGGAANYVHPEFGQIGPVLQDAMKCDNCDLDFHFSGLEAGPYELTTFHHSWFAVPNYNWAEFDTLVDVGDGNGFTTVQSNLSVSHNNDDPITDPGIYVTSFTSPGPTSDITVRLEAIRPPREVTGETHESPINGFVLSQVPEPGTGVLGCLGLLCLAAGRQLRRHG